MFFLFFSFFSAFLYRRLDLFYLKSSLTIPFLEISFNLLSKNLSETKRDEYNHGSGEPAQMYNLAKSFLAAVSKFDIFCYIYEDSCKLVTRGPEGPEALT